MEEGYHSINKFQKLIQCLELVSDLKVNWGKGSLTGIRPNLESVVLAANQLGCKIGSWPPQYLGVLLGGNPRTKAFWNLLIEMCQKKLAI